MSVASHSASAYMTSSLVTTTLAAAIPDVTRLLSERQISAVPVLDPRGSIVGVLSRSDLVRDQQRPAAERAATAGALMTQGPIVCMPSATLGSIARQMLEHRIHRIFLVEEGRLCGVISTTDLTRALAEARVDGELGAIMSTPVETIDVGRSVGEAIERLAPGRVSGLIATENDWPVGMFTQEEALVAASLDRTTPVGDLLDPSLVCLPVTTAIHRAAAQAARMGVRRIVVSQDRDFVGLVSSLDFAGVIARGA